MAFDDVAMSETFLMSNISPQKPDFNRKIWRDLEETVRYYASINDSIFVVTGPVLDNPIGFIGQNNVAVPRAFYKTIIAFNNVYIKGIAFIIPNQKSNESIYSYVVSIDDVERKTGIDFYYLLDDKVESKIEQNSNIRGW